jgi:hypothetical protein
MGWFCPADSRLNLSQDLFVLTEIVQPAIDFEEHLIKMPFVSGLSATSA